MRKLKLFFACLLMAVLSIGQVWAVDYDLVYTLDGSVTSGGNSNYAQDGGGLTQNGINWSVTGNTTINPWRIGGKNLNGVDRLAYSKTAIADNIAKIEIEHGTATLTVNSIKVEVASDAAFSNIISTFNESYSSNVTITELRPDGKDWTGRYYRITYNVTAGGSNSYVQLKSVKFYKEKSADDPVLESITISGDLENKSYEEGQSIDFTGLIATGHYNNSSTADLTDNVEWSFSPALTAGLTSVTVTATLDEISGNKEISGLTVAEHVVTPGTYDIPTHNDLWGTSYSGQASGITTLSGSKNDVSITINKNSGSTMYVTGSQTRIYSGYTMIFSVPNGYAITALQFTADGSNWAGDHTADVGTMTDNKNWSGEANSVTISVAGTCRMKAVKVTYAVAAPSKTETGLAYAEADQKKLTKLGEAFTAPTLENPNNLTVAYASNNTDVAEVASNGAVTIKAVGVATITASYDEDETYQAGSASYTIGVTTHAGTEADPYDVADAKIAIDAMGTVENAYATGLVSNVVTSTLPQEGYISFYFSADGNTTGQQIEAYKCYGLNSAPFEAVTDVKTGATVVVTGTLKKYNNTYEFDQNCHLVSYEAPAVPKTHIANDQANPYTVAQAITYAADGVTYDLDDYVYVQGVVYDVKSFSNGAMNIFIKDANAENQFELYKCAGINDGSSTTPFEALSDVQVGNIVIGYGQLTVYNTTYEFKQGNYLVDLQKPVTGVQLDQTEASVEEEATVTLTATILPSNATGTIVWTVESGSDKASVENGVVTGIAEGEATIRATVQGTEIFAECTVTVTEKSAPVTYDYALVTDAAQLQDGLKVIIVAANENKAAGSAAATYRYAVDVERTTGGEYLILDTENMPTEFTLGVPAAGQYTFNDGTGYMYENAAKSVKVQADPFSWSITIGDGNIATIQATNELRYNSGSPRFTTYASGQQALQLYVKNDGKQAAGLAWNPAEDIEITVGDEFTAPTLSNPNGLTVTIASDNTELATVENNVVSLVANVTGTAKITASFGGDDTYRAASVSYTITVSAAPQPASTDNVVIIAEYNNKFYALTNSISNKTAAAIEITKDGDNIIVPSDEAKAAIQWTRTTDGENTTFQDADDKYLKGVSNGGDLTLADDACNWGWNATDEYYFIGSRSFIYREGADGFKNYSTQNAGTQDYSNIAEVRVIDPENIVVVVPTTHTLSYNPNGGTLISGETEIAPAQVAEGATVTVAANVYEKENYMFAGWLYGETVYQAGQTFGMPTEDVELVAQWNPVSVSDYVLVTDVAQLKAGDKVIIVAADYNIAAGSAAATYRSTVEIAKTSDKSHLIFGASMPTEFTLGIMEDGYAFADVNGYMYESAAKSVKTQAEPFAWSISIDAEAIATISADNELRYNSGSPRFTTYASGQQDLQIYRKPSEFVEARNGLSAGRYYTICMEKNIMAVKNASFWSLTYKDAEQATEVYLVEETAPLVAGKPYIFQAGAATLDVIYGDKVVAAPIENGALRGTFTGIDAEAFAALTEDPYLLIENMLRPRTDGNYLNEHRAYVAFEALTVPETPNFAPGKRVRAIPMQPQVATGFDALNATEAPVKMIINGQLFILRGEKMYNVNGQLVK